MRILVVGVEDQPKLRAGSDAELRVDVREMTFDGPDAHEQRRRDLAIGTTGGGEPRHARLDLRQSLGPPASTDPISARHAPSRSTTARPVARRSRWLPPALLERAASACRGGGPYRGRRGFERDRRASEALVFLERQGQRLERRREVAVGGREQGSSAGGRRERPRALQGAASFLEPSDDLGGLVVGSELDQRRRVIGDEREHRRFPEPCAAMELPCALEVVTRGRRVAQRQLQRAQRRQRQELRVHLAARRACLRRLPRVRSRRVRTARGGPRGAPTSRACSRGPGAGTRALPRWSSDATQSPARNSIHPSSACSRPPASSSPEPTASSRSAVHIERLSSTSPVLAEEVREADARTSSDGARLGRRLELERLRHERPVDALPQPDLGRDERHERVGQRIGIVHRSGEPQRLLGIVQRGRQISERTRARSSATWGASSGHRPGSRPLGAPATGRRRPGVRRRGSRGRVPAGGAPPPDPAPAERWPRRTRGARTPRRGRRRAAGTRRPRRAGGARRRPGRAA